MRTEKLVAAVFAGTGLIAGCSAAISQPARPNVSQIATTRGWTDAKTETIPTYPAKREILFTASDGFSTIDFATFSSNAARDRWVVNQKAGIAKIAAGTDGVLATQIKTVRYLKGNGWAAVNEGQLSRFSSLGR